VHDNFEANAVINSGFIRISLLQSKQISNAGELINIVIDDVSCPSTALSVDERVSATLYDHNSDVIGLSNSGRFEMVAEALGLNMPVISLSSRMPGASNVTLNIKLRPTSVPSSPSRLLISLPGIGFSLSSSNVTFISPSSDVVAEAVIASGTINLSVSVLDIRINSGSFIPHRTVEFQLPGSFNIAELSQLPSDSVSAAWLFANNSVCAASVTGRFPEILPFHPHQNVIYGQPLQFIVSPRVHGFRWDLESMIAVSASMSSVSFFQEKRSNHIVVSVVPMFIGNDQLNVFHLSPGGVEMTILACPAIFELVSHESLCLSLSVQSNASLDFRARLNPSVMDAFPVLFVKWQGYLKTTRYELLTFQMQAYGHARIWLDGILQIDTLSQNFNGVISFSVNITSTNTLMYLRMECHGPFSHVATAVFWSSTRMSRQVRLTRLPLFLRPK
jgi:hypothetical protein